MLRFCILLLFFSIACKPSKNHNTKNFIDHTDCIKQNADKTNYDYSCVIGFTFSKKLNFTTIDGIAHTAFDNSILNLIHLASIKDSICMEESVYINELQKNLTDCVHIYSFYPESKDELEKYKIKNQIKYNLIADGIKIIQDSTDNMPFKYPCSLLLNKQNQVIAIYPEINQKNYHIVHNLIESTCNF